MPVAATIDATLNSQSATVTAYEDTTGDGNADNQQSIPLRDGQGAYQFPALSGTASNDHWLRFDLSTTDDSTTPQVNSATVEPEESTTVELSYNATLNSQSAYATILEDTTGDGNADTWVKLPIPGGSGTIGVAGTSGTMSNDHWMRVDLETSDGGTTPQVNSLSISSIEQFIQADVGVIGSDGPNASLAAGEAAIPATEATMSATGPNAGLSAGGITVAADTALVDLLAQDGAITSTATIQADAATLSATGVDAGVDPGEAAIAAITGEVSIEGVPGSLDAGATAIQADPALVSAIAANAEVRYRVDPATVSLMASSVEGVDIEADQIMAVTLNADASPSVALSGDSGTSTDIDADVDTSASLSADRQTDISLQGSIND